MCRPMSNSSVGGSEVVAGVDGMDGEGDVQYERRTRMRMKSERF